MSNREISMQDLLFASNAETTIPPTPVTGTPYRNVSINQNVAKEGWPYADVLNSADFNELFYRATYLLNSVEKSGLLFWSNKTDYPINSICRAEDGTIYESTAASGPNSGGSKNPLTTSGFWKKFYVGVGADGYEVVFVSASRTIQANQLAFCLQGGIILALSEAGILDGTKIKVCTGNTISLSQPVTIVGSAISEAACTSIIIDNANSSVELIWNAASNMWKVSSPTIGKVVAAQSGVGSAGRTIFDVFYSTSSETPAGALPLNGALIGNCNSLFPDFWSECVRRSAAGLISTKSEADWQYEYSSYGRTASFVIDSISHSVRLPSLKGYILPSVELPLYIQVYSTTQALSTMKSEQILSLVTQLQSGIGFNLQGTTILSAYAFPDYGALVNVNKNSQVQIGRPGYLYAKDSAGGKIEIYSSSDPTTAVVEIPWAANSSAFVPIAKNCYFKVTSTAATGTYSFFPAVGLN